MGGRCLVRGYCGYNLCWGMLSPVKSKILIVDDYEPLRFLKTLILSRAGFAVSQATTGADALSVITAEKPDLVLLDLNLPDVDGAEVCRQIKARPATSCLPVIFTTSGNIPPDLQASADGCVTSLEPDELIGSVQKLLNRAQPREAKPAASLDNDICAPTSFASAKRSPRQDVEKQARVLESFELARDILDASPCATAVLNENRQIIFCNRAWASLAGASDSRELLGMRPGESINCIQAQKTPGGCGTTEFCQTCLGVRTILEGLGGLATVRECQVTRNVAGREECLDILVVVSPLKQDEHFIVCSIVDIGPERRRQALERIFFHDILNIAEGLQGLADEIRKLPSQEEALRCMEMLVDGSKELVLELKTQQELLAAESGELKVTPSAISTAQLIRNLLNRYQNHPSARGRAVQIAAGCQDISMVSDERLLSRVLGNMLKNALEATAPGEVVTIGCRAVDQEVEFWVQNPGAMRKECQLQVFRRSFSTKDAGRGLGTYSMKLLSERYLRGSVAFRSNAEEGTTFFARYPRTIAQSIGRGA